MVPLVDLVRVEASADLSLQPQVLQLVYGCRHHGDGRFLHGDGRFLHAAVRSGQAA